MHGTMNIKFVIFTVRSKCLTTTYLLKVFSGRGVGSI